MRKFLEEFSRSSVSKFRCECIKSRRDTKAQKEQEGKEDMKCERSKLKGEKENFSFVMKLLLAVLQSYS